MSREHVVAAIAIALALLLPLFGSDYLGNAGSAGNVVRGLESYDGWTPQQLRAVYRDNALALLPRLRA